jgi:membrane-associated phospholipid phosphatase
MDAIDTIDWGAYAHFSFVAGKYPEVARSIQPLYYPTTYVVLVGLIAVVLLLFLLQKRLRAILIASIGFVASMGMIETCRLLVPRRRPPDAQELVGAQGMLGSYPSAGVFLFMLLLIYCGFALGPWMRSRVSRNVYVALAVLLTIGVAMSQFFLATHFVSDVVGGIIGAAIIGFVVSKFLDPANALNALNG